MSHRAITPASKKNWRTPQPVVDRLLTLGAIGLDPCSNALSLVPARARWTEENGSASLTSPWNDYGNWYANPPYGDGIEAWACKMAQEGSALLGSGNWGVGMVPANTGSSWFGRYVTKAAEILFWSPRLNFVGEPGKNHNNQDVCSPYWGSDVAAFRSAFAGCGWFRNPSC